ncbi:succinate dehydrogenase, hydrophobic membrane anchor protein [Novosphingobium mangrovi (ex Huang et al. 2023)]|uniref:Succinate dehydrogenase hydrophobic membrane anchor subunit n=1 Tax=Novosphingobium mangrovi (ex Huang et al. 2023) TaxID=2976432 RepID=A0ABT2I7A4_9SPHN|nr:succinate dehydrogenase, hydrophobic membrane anchor protein [Novosphingobium mangrovi (ex Huang et al. 2023)]MCT2400697.1 succinate dehydrogenase, hydrophobic membrane anchor protein [Novosphingobium mangrovi (ex Huang et al. 2023)]
MGNGTSIGRVRGLGSAKSGTHHWLLQRFTAIGNLLLLLWLAASIVLLPDLSYASVADWLATPVPAVAMILLVVSSFWHARLGMQVMVEDYVHEHANKFACIAALNLVAFAGAAFGVFCVVRLALGAHA